MDDAQLRRLAKDSGIPIEKIAEWHFIHAPRFISAVQRAHKRPEGMLSVTDVVAKYHIDPQTLMEWRKAGLKTQRKGKMILIRESDVVDWTKKYAFIRKPRGRPKGS